MPFYKKWTPKLAQRRAKDRIAKIDALLIEIASLYGDIDEGICTRCDELRREFEGFGEEIDQSTADIIERNNWR